MAPDPAELSLVWKHSPVPTFQYHIPLLFIQLYWSLLSVSLLALPSPSKHKILELLGGYFQSPVFFLSSRMLSPPTFVSLVQTTPRALKGLDKHMPTWGPIWTSQNQNSCVFQSKHLLNPMYSVSVNSTTVGLVAESRNRRLSWLQPLCLHYSSNPLLNSVVLC